MHKQSTVAVELDHDFLFLLYNFIQKMRYLANNAILKDTITYQVAVFSCPVLY